MYQTGKLNLRQYWCSGKLENSLLGRDNIIKRVDPEDDHEEKDPGSPDLLGAWVYNLPLFVGILEKR